MSTYPLPLLTEFIKIASRNYVREQEILQKIIASSTRLSYHASNKDFKRFMDDYEFKERIRTSKERRSKVSNDGKKAKSFFQRLIRHGNGS